MVWPPLMTETINDNQRRSVKMIGIPMQFFPSQEYPGLQVQLWDPWVLCNILHSHHRYGFCFHIHLYLMTGTRKHNNSIGMLHTNCNAFLSISRVSRVCRCSCETLECCYKPHSDHRYGFCFCIHLSLPEISDILLPRGIWHAVSNYQDGGMKVGTSCKPYV